ncbi:MAG: YkgJ family cysteine cluster protein [bacterium]|nr:YkgJ family cysteine cluster protein [bacterium]
MVDDVARQADACIAQSPGRPAHACAAGCTFCCHLPVDMTVPEALRIVAHLRQTLSSQAFATLHARLAATAGKINGLSYEDHSQAKIPCALLIDGSCAVYPHRPLACRAWSSTSRDGCENIFEHGDPVSMLPPLDMQAYEAVWEVAHGMTDGLKQARLDSNTYELHSILLRAIEVPAAVQRWLQHDDVFAGCTVGAFAG